MLLIKKINKTKHQYQVAINRPVLTNQSLYTEHTQTIQSTYSVVKPSFTERPHGKHTTEQEFPSKQDKLLTQCQHLDTGSDVVLFAFSC